MAFISACEWIQHEFVRVSAICGTVENLRKYKIMPLITVYIESAYNGPHAQGAQAHGKVM